MYFKKNCAIMILMIPPELIKEIQELRAKGNPDETIKLILEKAGWPKPNIEQAFRNDFANTQSALADQNVTNNIPQSEFIETPHIIPAQSTQTQSGSNNEPQTTNEDVSQSYPKNIFAKFLTGEKKFRVFLAGLLIGLIASVYPSYKAISVGVPVLNNLEQRLVLLVEEVFPENLKITFENGEAKTNVTEPFHLTVHESTIKNIVIPDTSSSQPTFKIRLIT
jgi:hypothetical protein